MLPVGVIEADDSVNAACSAVSLKSVTSIFTHSVSMLLLYWHHAILIYCAECLYIHYIEGQL